MQKFTRLIILLLLILIGMYFFLPNKPYLSRSKIHGDGLFAGKSYQKGEIIFEDLFPPPADVPVDPVEATAPDTPSNNE